MLERIAVENLFSDFEVFVFDLLQNQFELHLISVGEQRLDLEGSHVERRHLEEILLALIDDVHVVRCLPIEFLVKNHILGLNVAFERFDRRERRHYF